MDFDDRAKYETRTHILCAFDFKDINDENRILLNNYINEQVCMALKHVKYIGVFCY